MKGYGARPPEINRDAAEQPASVWDLSCHLDILCRQQTAFYYAVRLFAHCGEQVAPIWQTLSSDRPWDADKSAYDQWRAWQIIAARDGAIRLVDFAEALQAVNGPLNQAFGEKVEKVRPSPEDLFKEHFPKAHKIRHSAAHGVTKNKNQKQHDKHSFDGGYVSSDGGILIDDTSSGNTFADCLSGDSYIGNWEKEMVSYPVTMESVRKLEKVKLACFAKIPTSALVKSPS